MVDFFFGFIWKKSPMLDIELNLSIWLLLELSLGKSATGNCFLDCCERFILNPYLAFDFVVNSFFGASERFLF